MGKREDAIIEGKKTFISDKPCRKGHMAERYTSNSACIECLRLQNDARQGRLKAATIKRNTALFAGFQPSSFLIRLCDRDLMQRLADVLQYGTPDQVANCAATIESVYARCSIPRALKLEDLAQIIQLDGAGNVTRECMQRLPVSHSNDFDGVPHLYINGYVYDAAECMAVMRHQRLNVTPKSKA